MNFVVQRPMDPMNSHQKRHRRFPVYRKIWHMAGVFVPVLFYLQIFSFYDDVIPHATRVLGVSMMSFFLVVVLTIEVFRLRSASVNRFIFQHVGILFKSTERHHINATVPYIFSHLILASFFRLEIYVMAAIFLTVGDPFAAFVGGRYGRIRINGDKSLEGSGAFILASFLVGFVFLILHTLLMQSGIYLNDYYDDSFVLLSQSGMVKFGLIWILLSGVVFASLGEGLSITGPYGFLDDNLMIPFWGTFGMTMAAFFIAGFEMNQIFYSGTVP